METCNDCGGRGWAVFEDIFVNCETCKRFADDDAATRHVAKLLFRREDCIEPSSSLPVDRWHYESHGTGWTIMDENRLQVALVDSSAETSAERRLDAARIVRAVNAHAGILETLQRIQVLIQGELEHPSIRSAWEAAQETIEAVQ